MRLDEPPPTSKPDDRRTTGRVFGVAVYRSSCGEVDHTRRTSFFFAPFELDDHRHPIAEQALNTSDRLKTREPIQLAERTNILAFRHARTLTDFNASQMP